MKKILFISGSGTPQDPIDPPTYFVSNAGDDANDGLTELTAWQTISKTVSMSNSFVAGDIIAFKSGDKWIGERYYTASHPSGTAGNPITFTSYGSGAKPIITLIIDQTPTWTDIGGNIWTTPRTKMRTWKNGIELLMASSLAQLQNPVYGTGWWDDAVTTYVYSTTDPTLDTYSWSNSNYTFYMDNASYITFNNLDIQGSTSGALRAVNMDNLTVINCNLGKDSRHGINSLDSDNVLINNNTIDADFTVDYSQLPEDNSDFRSVGDGLFIREGSTNWTITNNYFKNWGHNGIYVTSGDIARKALNVNIYNNELTCPDIGYGRGLGADGYVEDSEIYNNYVHNTAAQLQVLGSNNHFHHNIIIDLVAPVMWTDKSQGSGLNINNYFKGVMNNIYENNIFINIEGPGIYMNNANNDINDTSGNIIRNNILYNTGTLASQNNIGIRFIENIGIGIFNNLFQNNLVYNSSTTLTCQASNGGAITNVSDFNNANADISNTIDGNPLFVDLQSDWHLLPGSPAMNSGTPAMSTIDYYGEIMNLITPNIGISDNRLEQNYIFDGSLDSYMTTGYFLTGTFTEYTVVFKGTFNEKSLYNVLVSGNQDGGNQIGFYNNNLFVQWVSVSWTNTYSNDFNNHIFVLRIKNGLIGQLLVDGVEVSVSTSVISDCSIDTGRVLVLGAFRPDERKGIGQLSHVYLYDRMLDDQEVNNVVNDINNNPQPNLLLEYKNNKTLGTWTEEVGGNDATNGGSVTLL